MTLRHVCDVYVTYCGMHFYILKVNKNKLYEREPIITKILGKWFIDVCNQILPSSSSPINTTLLKQQTQGSTFFSFSIWCKTECMTERRHHGRLFSATDVIFSNESYWFLACSKREDCFFVLYANISCLLVLCPQQEYSSKSRQSLHLIIYVLHAKLFRLAPLHSSSLIQACRQ